MGTTNYVSVEVRAHTDGDMPSAARLLGAWNIAARAAWLDTVGIIDGELDLPGIHADVDYNSTRAYLQFETGGVEEGPLATAAKRLSARFAVDVSISIENEDDRSTDESLYRYGEFVLTGEGGPLHTLLNTAQIIRAALDHFGVSWVGDGPVDEFAAQIDRGEILRPEATAVTGEEVARCHVCGAVLTGSSKRARFRISAPDELALPGEPYTVEIVGPECWRLTRAMLATRGSGFES